MDVPSLSDYQFFIQFAPAIMDSVPLLIINLNDRGMGIIFASPLAEKLFGYDRGELKYKNLDILLRPEDIVLHHLMFARFQKNPLTRAMNNGISVNAVRKDGSQIKIQVALGIQQISSIKCVVAAIADVTKIYNQGIAETLARYNNTEELIN